MPFVKDFKNIQVKSVSFPPVEKIYKWDKNTKKFVKDEIDWQKEINKNKHIELKEMLKRNILPKVETPASYGDVSNLRDVTMADVFRASNIEFVSDAEKKVEQTKKDVDKSDTKDKLPVDEKSESK